MKIKGGLWNQLQSDLQCEYVVHSSKEGIAEFNRLLFSRSLIDDLNYYYGFEKIHIKKYSRLKEMAESKSMSDLYMVELIIKQIENELNIQRKRSSV